MRLALAGMLALAWVAPADAACRQALALGLDISGSVDDAEYRQQIDGLAGALVDPEVRAALLAMPGATVDLAVYEWSGPLDQRLILPWRSLVDGAAIQGAAVALTATRRVAGEPSTALGAAMAFGARLLGQRPGCWRQVLDLSGDGAANTGPRPQDLRDGLTPPEMTINALVIATPGASGTHEDLPGYFRANVIRGPEAFVETARGFADYQAAMRRKLLRELQVLAIGQPAPLRALPGH